MLITGRHCAPGRRTAGAPPPRGGAPTVSGHLKASLTFSPACFRLPATLSLVPSACRSRLSVASPSDSLPSPESSWALFFILSTPLMGRPPLVRRSMPLYPRRPLLTHHVTPVTTRKVCGRVGPEPQGVRWTGGT